MTYKEYLGLAIPFVLSTVTQPLLGAVDTAVLGRLSDASFMGGVAIGTVVLNTLYWLFGFLRVSTSGFSAQTLGTRNQKEIYYAYFRPVIIALITGIGMIALQNGIWNISQGIYAPEKEVLHAFKTYYYILIWGAPLVLISYVNIGWLMGRKHVKETLVLQIGTNIMNIILDLVLVVYLKMGVQGVAVATLVSQGFGFLVGLLMISVKMDIFKALEYKSNFLSIDAFKKIAMVNTDLFVRTVCLLVMTHFFVSKGSTYGKTVLAANAVLFQIQYIIAYLYDGLANASSVFAGKALGEENSEAFEGVLHISKKCTYALSTGILCILIVFRKEIIQAFTSLAQVREIAGVYSGWLILFPFSIGIGLVYYGIFTGCTFTRPVRDSMVISLVAFLAVYLGFVPTYKNHGLWAAFIVFSAGRSFILVMNIKKLKRLVFKDSAVNYCYNHTQ